MKKKQQVVAVEDIHLYGKIISVGSVGYRSQWRGRLKQYKSDDSAIVVFPQYQKHAFVTLSESVKNV